MANTLLPVSVVICVRDRAAELADCLDSLRDANVTEIIVVDGCSADGTVDVARARGARIISDEGRGLGYARRLGVLAADQPFVMFVDSDVTIPDPTTISRMLDELITHGYAGLHAMVESGGSQTIWEHAQDTHFRLTFNKPGPRAAIGCVAALFKREVLLACLPDPLVSAAEDGDLSRQIIESGGRLGVASVSVMHSHRGSFLSLWNQRNWYGRGNARRAWKDRSAVYLLGPALTAGYLVWRGFRTRSFSLIPYAVIHGCAGLLGEVSELISLAWRNTRGSVRSEPKAAPGGTMRVRLYDSARKVMARLALQVLSQVDGSGPVLDVGCGPGLIANYLACHQARAIHGIDIGAVSVAAAKAAGDPTHTTFLVYDGAHVPYPENTFDAVLCIEVIEHVQDDNGLISEIVRVLRPGGVLLLSTPDAAVEDLNSKEHHVRHYTATQLIDLIERSGLQIQQLAHRYHPIGAFMDGVLMRFGPKVAASTRLDDDAVVVDNRQPFFARVILAAYDRVIDPIIEAIVWMEYSIRKHGGGADLVVFAVKPCPREIEH